MNLGDLKLVGRCVAADRQHHERGPADTASNGRLEVLQKEAVMKLAGQAVLVTGANPSGAVKAMERQNADFLAPALVGSDQRNEGDEA